jgi:hypothetical protein
MSHDFAHQAAHPALARTLPESLLDTQAKDA